MAWPSIFPFSNRERWVSTGLSLLVDLVLVLTSFGGALLLRYGGTPPPPVRTELVYQAPLLVSIKLATFYAWDLHRGMWTHAGTPEAVRIITASTLASAGVFAGTALLPGVASLSVALAILDWMLTTAAAGGRRLLPRALRHYQFHQDSPQRRILIAGADPDGIFAFRCLRRRLPPSCSVVGFLDPTSAGLQVQGRPVVASVDGLRADALVVPSSAPTKEYQAALEACRRNDVTFCWMATTLTPSSPEAPAADADSPRSPTATPQP